MNYREKIRKALECPQFGNINYGEWGTLRLDQRKSIKRLLDEMDGADEVIKHQFFEIERLNNIINELEKWLNKNLEDIYSYFENTPFGVEDTYREVLDKLQELKGSDKQ